MSAKAKRGERPNSKQAAVDDEPDIRGPRMFSIPLKESDQDSDSDHSVSSTEEALKYLAAVRKQAQSLPKVVVADLPHLTITRPMVKPSSSVASLGSLPPVIP